MGADLFDSNVTSCPAALVAAATLGGIASKNVIMVFAYAAIGLLSSIIGVATARIGKNGDPNKALSSSTYVTTAVFAVLTALTTYLFGFQWRIWAATAVGLIVGTVIGIATDYFTNDNKPPVQEVAKASKSGPALPFFQVFHGLLSCLPALISIAISALVAFKVCAFSATTGARSRVWNVWYLNGCSRNAFYCWYDYIQRCLRTIVDNARGLAEMGGFGEKSLL